MAIPTNTTPFSNLPANTNVIDATAVNEKFDRLYNYLQAGVEKVVPALMIPVGLIAPFASGVIPAGWLICDGAAKLRSQYPELFTALGTAYGAGDGSTTFNMPDLKGRAPIGKGAHADVTALAQSDGLADASRTPKRVLATSEMPAHSHGVNDPAHAHTTVDGQLFSIPAAAGAAGPYVGSVSGAGGVGYNASTGWNYTGISLANTGGGGQHNHGFQVVNFIIRATP